MKKPEIDMQSKKIMVETKTYSEMIDALIKLHGYVKDNQPNYLLSSKYISLHEIESALKKAGCHD